MFHKTAKRMFYKCLGAGTASHPRLIREIEETLAWWVALAFLAGTVFGLLLVFLAVAFAGGG